MGRAEGFGGGRDAAVWRQSAAVAGNAALKHRATPKMLTRRGRARGRVRLGRSEAFGGGRAATTRRQSAAVAGEAALKHRATPERLTRRGEAVRKASQSSAHHQKELTRCWGGDGGDIFGHERALSGGRDATARRQCAAGAGRRRRRTALNAREAYAARGGGEESVAKAPRTTKKS